jgi:hypothetical protein
VRAVVAVNRATLDGLVDRRDEIAVRRVGSCVVAVFDERLEAAEVRLDRRGVLAVLETLALGAQDALLLRVDVGHEKSRVTSGQLAQARRGAPYYSGLV